MTSTLTWSSFVPAESATLGLVDKSHYTQITRFLALTLPLVFTRISTRESVSKVITLPYLVVSSWMPVCMGPLRFRTLMIVFLASFLGSISVHDRLGTGLPRTA